MTTPQTLLRQAIGATGWVQLLGRSMLPLLRSGDLLHVVRCPEEDIHRGDLVVVLHESDRFLAHLAASRGGSQTVGIGGEPDQGRLLLVGKVDRIRRRDVEIPVGKWARPAMWSLHVVGRQIRRAVPARSLAESLAGLVLLPGVRHIRRKFIRVPSVRPLTPLDLPKLIPFATHHLETPPALLERQLLTRWKDHGACVGAFDETGEFCGFVYLDEAERPPPDGSEWWVRSLHVTHPFRRLGVGGRLIKALELEARTRGISRVKVECSTRNEVAQQLFLRLGYARSNPAVETPSVVVLERRL